MRHNHGQIFTIFISRVIFSQTLWPRAREKHFLRNLASQPMPLCPQRPATWRHAQGTYCELLCKAFLSIRDTALYSGPHTRSKSGPGPL
ncbi:hypothetical protein FVE85_1708 [Porphyridium purpureum]|uniref:Uncharacterized protein n=1 Tax=Porphyridium purpureum TaxID=35688 RepID=A0A5J4YY52_PORPP|nr:hypothetical protein FVE85_1708 [Porphyridium purpureum]|eukprot:POR0593..scf209_3